MSSSSPGTLVSSGGAEFTALEDGSFLLTGAAPDKDDYTVVVSAEGGGFTGLRLEAPAYVEGLIAFSNTTERAASPSRKGDFPPESP